MRQEIVQYHLTYQYEHGCFSSRRILIGVLDERRELFVSVEFNDFGFELSLGRMMG